MNNIVERIIYHHEMIDAIRIRKNTDITVETLKDDLSISRTTADKFYFKLSGKEEDTAIIMRKDRSIRLCPDMGYFLGISLGSSHIRATLLKLDFEPVPRHILDSYPGINKLLSLPEYNSTESSETSYAFKASENTTFSFDTLRSIVSQILDVFLTLGESFYVSAQKLFPLMGIGFAVTGPVDYTSQLWRSASRITNIRDITLTDLIGYENMKRIDRLELFLSLDNNAKTAIISEYQFLMEQNPGHCAEDLVLIYVGSGIGSAAVLNRTLLRGYHNLSGELGQIRIGTAEQNGEFSSPKTLEEHLQSEENYIHYIPQVLNTINCILGIDRFLLVGHSIIKNKTLIPSLMDRRLQFTVASTQQYCKAEKGRGDASTAAIGAAMEAYFTMCAYDLTADDGKRVNLAQNISWNPVKG